MIVGIDLGTSNSAIAIWRDGEARLIPNSLGDVLTPSAVSLDDEGRLLVGRAARDRQVSDPASTATSFKRYMGTSRSTKLGKRIFLPEELSALVLGSLKADAEAYLGESVTEAVITVPAYFNDKQRKATRRAGELAGFKVERLLNEPTAAALAYGLHKLGSDTRFLVFDLGGGTFDVSILEIFDGVIEVRATAGDNRLGGNDFNEALVDELFAKFRSEWRLLSKEADPALYQQMLDQCERVRRQLGLQQSATARVVWRGQNYEHTFKQADLEQHAAKLIVRLREPVLQALRDSGIRSEAINEVILAGGATRMPLVRQIVTRMFGRFPAVQFNPDEVVALGAAIQAGLKMRDADLKEVVLTDVCPFSLGVDVGERLPDGSIRMGIFAPIIERNTVIPASRSHVFSTLTPIQTIVHFNIYQGEARLVQDNIRLGEINVPVPRGSKGDVQVECRFTYDINGLLEVDVCVPSTGETRQLVIMDNDTSMNPATLASRRAELAALKVHPRDQAENAAALARANRCYEQFLGDKRDLISRMLSEFETALEKQYPREIEQARAALHQQLDLIEGERFL
jgi:molecular chaperone HscC